MVVAGIIYIKARKSLEVFPPTIMKFWKDWELRCLILQSLLLQIILIIFGNRRKVSSKVWVRILLWGAYLMADKVATVALGALMNNIAEVYEEESKKLDANTQLTAFWAPFLLVHLGGPDTITAYALEDTELWLRHLLELGVQTGVAMYVFLLSWTGSLISIIAVPMFFVGIIKYGERIWCLKSASVEEMKESIDIIYIESEREEVIEHPNSLIKANYFFNIFKRLFVDSLISLRDLKTSQSMFKKISFNEGFEVVGFELGFMYDLLYTKRRIMFTSKACWLRLITFITTCIVLVLFSLSNKSHCSKIDVAITFLLLVIAILLELYAMVLLVFSDWMILRLCQGRQVFRLFGQAQRSRRRWSNSLAQYSFLRYSIKMNLASKRILVPIFKFFNIKQILKYQNVKSVEVSGLLKDFTFSYLKRKCEGLTWWEIDEDTRKHYKEDYKIEVKDKRKHYKEDYKIEVKDVLKHRGDYAIRDFPRLKWSVSGEFEHSVLIWHVATALLQVEENKLTIKVDDGSKKSETRHGEKITKDDGQRTQASSSEQKNEQVEKNENDYKQISKLLSRYMMYLLVMCPSMVPTGVGKFNYHRKALEEAYESLPFNTLNCKNIITSWVSNLFKNRNLADQFETRACEMLLAKRPRILEGSPRLLRNEEQRIVLPKAVMLASDLEKIPRKWELVSETWMEMLVHAASQSRGSDHAKQLAQGGEFITHLWFLMAHFGLIEQIDLSYWLGIPRN